MANDMIRMSGMNSGLDTESIINALTANSKLKITKQERNVKKYEATQEAYRDIIGKMQALKSKYFDILNSSSNLSGTTMWSKFAAKTYDTAGKETSSITGLSVKTSINSQTTDYSIAVEEKATQTKISGGSLSTRGSVALGGLRSGQTYGMTVTVGSEEKSIQFTAGDDEAATRANLNQALEDAFGESNSSVGSGVEGMVYVGADNKFVSREAKGITFTGIGTMSTENKLNITNAKAGTNSLSFQVGDKTLNVSFQTIDTDYFKSAIDAGLIDPSTGETLIPSTEKDTDGEYKWQKMAKAAARTELESNGGTPTDEEVQKRANELITQWDNATQLYEATADDFKESVRYDAFKEYMSAGTDEEKAAKLERLYQSAEAEHKDTQMSKWIEADTTTFGNLKTVYESYVTAKKNEGASEDEIETLYQYAKRNRESTWTADDGITDFSDLRNAFDALEDKYDGTTKLQNKYAEEILSDEAKASYAEYKSNNSDAVGIYEWAQTNASSELSNASQTFEEWKTANPETVNDANWHLTKDTWALSESNQFTAFKNLAKNDASFKADVYNEDTKDYGITAEKMYTHFTESSIKNSIGKLEVDGVKFDAALTKSVDANTGKDVYTVSVSAYTEDSETGEKTDVAVSMTVGANSANKADDFGLSASSDATTSISQITNSTKLSDLGIAADSDGKYSFKINNVSFSFDGDTSVNDMMKKINASSAGVKMTYSSLDNAFTMTASQYGLDGKIDIEDSSGGFMEQIGMSDTNKTRGTNLRAIINGVEYESAGNTIEADGTTFTIGDKFVIEKDDLGNTKPVTVSIEKDNSAIADVIKNFVKDYNQLIDDVYKYLDEKPEKDYYFLADADKEDLDLSEKQEEQWEEKAKKGLLYHDSTTTSIMSKLRTALMGAVEGLDGDSFYLGKMGLKTVSDYSQHGKFADIDETALNDAIENHADDIMKLFTDSENGIMKKFAEALDSGVKATGDDKGSLVRKAGLSSGTSATDNEIYNAIKRTKTRITSLTRRYEDEQDRLWKRYSAMESMLGTLNSQQSSFSSYFMQ